MNFEPIAIVGQACVLPGALTPRALVDLVLEGKDVLSTVPNGYWRTDPALVMTDTPKTAKDQTWCDKGGYVQGFESIFNPDGFTLPGNEIMQYDPLVHWLLHTAREALQDAGHLFDHTLKTGIICGNLSYPSHGVTKFSEAIWLDAQGKNFLDGRARELAGLERPHPANRFMSGMPTHVVAKALGLKGEAFAVDAACASSLYAIKLACDQLHDRKADLMLAGGVNRADDLIIHIGFCVLKAMSHTGRSRPFHKNADGLVPTEGAGLVALKRLDDAVAAGDTIYGVIRSIGVANDARGKGLLVPSAEGQARAMRLAYKLAGLTPADISLLECHATGTPVGDGIEVKSTADVFQGLKNVPIGTIKSNMGHPITVSGIAGLLKVTGAMKAGIRPRTLHVEDPLEELKNTPFRLITENEPWEADAPRRAAISNFGFGGNNAHLIVEEWTESSHTPFVRKSPLPGDDIAVVGLGVIAADAIGKEAFAKALFTGDSRLRDQEAGVFGGYTESFELPMLGLNFPPADLKQTLPQQLLMLKAAMEAVSEAGQLPRERTCLFAGMGCDAEVSRGAMGWKMKQLVRDWTGKADLSDMASWIENAKAQINPYGKAPAVLGAMPNIVANRMSNQFDIGGPGFSVSSEELSGITALNLAVRALKSGEMDAAVVGAVDVSCEQVHAIAVKELLPKEKHIPGDAAVALVLKKYQDAVKDGNTIYAVLPDDTASETGVVFGPEKQQINLEPVFGHAHAASGLVYLAAAALSCYYQMIPNGKDEKAAPWYQPEGTRSADIRINALHDRSAKIRIQQGPQQPANPMLFEEMPDIYIYSGSDRQEVLANLEAGRESDTGNARLVIAALPETLPDMRDQAIRMLRADDAGECMFISKGIYYCEKPVEGELAFVFTGAGGAYQGMGRELIMAFPDVMKGVESRFNSIGRIADWLYSPGNNAGKDPEKLLWASSFLCQIHAEMSQKMLGLAPAAALGFSSGESNSLFALGAWNDMDDMAREFHDMGVYQKHVGGEFETIRKAWKEHGVASVDWTNWHVQAGEEEVTTALASEPLARLTIKNSPKEMIISGQREACERVIAGIGNSKAIPLPYNIANHCPEIEAYKDDWRRLHMRKTNPVPDVRFYTGATCSHYQPTADKAADAILGMATRTLDFPKMVENAWQDGARIFLEHGPGESCSRWIKDTLGEKEHIAVPLDKKGRSPVTQLVHAAAQLLAAGVPVDYKAVTNRKPVTGSLTAPDKQLDDSPLNKTITYGVHAPFVTFPPLDNQPARKDIQPSQSRNIPADEIVQHRPESGEFMPASQPVTSHISQKMAPAPSLPPTMEDFGLTAPSAVKAVHPMPSSGNNTPVQDQPAQMNTETAMPQAGVGPANDILGAIVNQNAMVSHAHKEFLNQSMEIRKRLMEQRNNALSILMNASRTSGPQAVFPSSPQPPVPRTPVNFTPPGTGPVFTSPEPDVPEAMPEEPVHDEIPKPVEAWPEPLITKPAAPVFVRPKTPEKTETVPKPAADTEKKKSASGKKPSAMDALRRQFENPVIVEPAGPSFSKDQLKILASGKISEVFGPLFEQQDDYEIQVRLPEPPLLLVDRITGIDAEAGSMGKGIIWTETDVTEDAWYLNDIYMPGGITIESGQCDLTLISYLGIDFLNKGKRAYRLLGCDLMYYGTPPKVGDTLCYQIHVDGHANMGGQRMFFFHYDCRVNGELRLSVRNGQAAFITREEAENAGGVLWTPETGEHKPLGKVRLDPPEVVCTRNRFSKEQVKAFTEGRAYECFGKGFELMASHSKTPKIPSGMMALLHEVTAFDPMGGPWKRGYIRVENKISPDDWFLPGHFKNDNCMPGTLMSEACMQTLAFYLAAMGFTVKRDGWRFDPVPNEVYQAKCRAQVTPKNRNLTYEAFIEEVEVVDGLYPTVYADLVATCDGKISLHIRRLGVRLVPDFPLDCRPHLLEGHTEKKPVAEIDGFKFDYRSLMACAYGKPSEAFGDLGKHFDKGHHIARLPGPPYHFMTRVPRIDATMGGMIRKGEMVEVEYDVPEDAWYFDENGRRTMPFCVLMEVALQPCGWLSVFEGGVGISEEPLLFRNLDGTGIQIADIPPDTETILTRAVLTGISKIKGMALFNFDVECYVRETLVYTMKTGFGFFLREAFEEQFGLPMSKEAREKAVADMNAPCDFLVDLTARPEQYCDQELRLPGPMLLMLDRVTGYWPDGGEKGLGRLRAEKDVNIHEWFFKAHFFQDPVQPGSLGVEALIQLLQFYMIHENMGEGIENPRFEPIALGQSVTWRYRGQVIPINNLISSEINIVETGRDEKGAYAVAEGWLWVDGRRIYHVKDLTMRIVSGSADDNPKSTVSYDVTTGRPVITGGPVSADREIIDQVARQIRVPADRVSLSEDRKTAAVKTMPLNLFPVTISDKDQTPLVTVGESFLNREKVLSYGRSLLDIGSWVGEDLSWGLCERFVGKLVVEDPDAFEKVKGSNVLYLANHQVQIESMLFPGLAQVLTDNRIVAIADADHRRGWMGPLNDIVYDHPEVDYPRNIVYFDRQDRKSMFQILDNFKNMIADEGISVFLHVEGKLGLSCRNPVKTLSSVFIDLAQECRLPIIPVRFAGGLPVENMSKTIDFPYGYCKQAYYVGKPVFPDELGNLPYAKRRKFVMDAINHLGPDMSTETPNDPDPGFAKAVADWQNKKKVPEMKAVLFKTLENLSHPPAGTTEILLKAAQGEPVVGNDAKSRWLKKIASWLFEN